MNLSETQNIIWKDVYVYKYMKQQPTRIEMLEYIFWREELKIEKVKIGQISSIDWLTVDWVRASEHTTKSDFGSFHMTSLLRPEELFFSYEECEKDLQKKIKERQDIFTNLYGGEFKSNIVLVS